MISQKILKLTGGLTRIVSKSWDDLVDDIKFETKFVVSSEYVSNPQKHIFLYDVDGEEYVAEVTQYYDGDYELLFDNVHPTGFNERQRNVVKSVKSSSYVRSASGVKLYVEYYPYERYGGGKKKKVNITGTDLRDALYKMVSKLMLYLYPEDIEDDDMTAEEILESIESSNGDGCDYITKLENKTTGELLLSGFDEDDEIEEW